MNAKLFTVAAAALVALTSAASAVTLDPAYSQKDAELRQQALKVVPEARPVYITPSAIDPAYSQRDAQLRAQAEKGAIVTTHGGGYAVEKAPVIDPAFSQKDAQLRAQAWKLGE